jgi:hypothetical protein
MAFKATRTVDGDSHHFRMRSTSRRLADFSQHTAFHHGGLMTIVLGYWLTGGAPVSAKAFQAPAPDDELAGRRAI